MKHFHEAHRSKCGIRMDLNYNMGIYNAAYCRQCDAPGCVLACRKGACYIDAETGIRRIDKETCVGCKLCMKACPFDAVVYDAAAKKCFKCDLCDGDPTCAKQCPSRAIKVISTSKKRGERQ
jgi:Fe-S-cluster-containing dehydrogenase component